MNKTGLVPAILSVLRNTLAAGVSAARATANAATDPDSKAENKYDTRNLEASYLARGQAFRAAETMEAIREYEALFVKDFAPGAPIGMGALVLLHGAAESFYCFIGPAAGGTEVTVDGASVMLITPSSPLGAKLMGKKAGASLEMQPGRPASTVVIAEVA